MAKANRDIKTYAQNLERLNMRPQRIYPGSYGTTQSAISAINQRSSFVGRDSGGGGSASRFSRLLDSINPKLANFLSSTGLIPPEMARLVGGLGKFGLAIGVAVTALMAFKAFAENLFKYGNLLEQSKIVLKSIYGSETKATDTLRGMREYSRKTQFLPEEVVGATTMMAKYNVDPFKKGNYGLPAGSHVMNLMSGLAAMPGMGGKPIGLDRAVNAVIAGRDIRPIKALGPEAIAAYELAKKSGTSGSPAFIKTMLTELAKVPKILALGNEQMNTMSGLWSTIAGYAEEVFMDISGAGEQAGVTTFWSQIKEILMDMRGAGERFIQYIGPYLVEFGAFLGANIKYIWDILKQIGQIIAPVIVPAFKVLVQVLRAAWEIARALMDTAIKIGQILWTVLSAPLKLIAVLFGVNGKLNDMIRRLMDFVSGLKATFILFKIWMEGIVEAISGMIDLIIRKFTDFYNKYKPFIDLLMSNIPGISGIQAASNIVSQYEKTYTEETRRKNAEGAADFLGKSISMGTSSLGGNILTQMGKGWETIKSNAASAAEREKYLKQIDKINEINANLRKFNKTGDTIINNYQMQLYPTTPVKNANRPF